MGNDVDEKLHYKMPRKFLRDNLGTLTGDEVAVLLVVSRHFNEWQWMFAGIDVIQRESGVKSERAVESALESLVAKGILRPVKKFVYGCERQAYESLLDNSYGVTYVKLHHDLVDSDVWAALPGTSKKLYLSMRLHARIDCADAIALEIVDPSTPEADYYKNYFPVREFEVCDELKSKLSACAGFSDTNFKRSLAPLLEHGLVEALDDEGAYRVNLSPNVRFHDRGLETKKALIAQLAASGASPIERFRAIRDKTRLKKFSVDHAEKVLAPVLTEVITAGSANSPQSEAECDFSDIY